MNFNQDIIELQPIVIKIYPKISYPKKNNPKKNNPKEAQRKQSQQHTTTACSMEISKNYLEHACSDANKATKFCSVYTFINQNAFP